MTKRVLTVLAAVAVAAGLCACEAKDLGQMLYNGAKKYCDVNGVRNCDTN
jgi:hypothetical protein